MDLTDAQWRRIEPLLPKPRRRLWRDPRDVLNEILWVMRTSAQWDEMSDRYPPRSTCHRRFQLWARSGTMYRILRQLTAELAAVGGYDFSEAFIDATFAVAKKGASPSASPAGGKAPRSWQSQTVLVFLSPLLSQLRPRVRLDSLTTY